MLPATVLHDWDFAKQPVCSLAAEYLASIQDKPLLCVGAVNPGLHARVPTLARAHDLRVRAYKALAAAQDKVQWREWCRCAFGNRMLVLWCFVLMMDSTASTVLCRALSPQSVPS